MSNKPSTSTYSFDDVEIVFAHPGIGQYIINGKGVGSITVSMQTEKTTHDVAADGSIMASKIAGNNAAIDIEVQQTSEFHKWLTNYYNFVLLASASQWTGASIIIKDNVGGSLITALGVSPVKKADKPYQAQGQRVTWPFLSTDCQEVAI